jgi:hypothetical protein
MFFVENMTIGLIALVVGMLLVPLRISTWASVYLELAEPVREFDNVIQEIRREREATAAASGTLSPVQPSVQQAMAKEPSLSPELLRKRIKWVLIGIIFPLIMAVALFSVCWSLRELQVWLFSQPWKSGPLAGCPNWLPVDSRKAHFDAISYQQEIFCAIEYDYVACEGRLAQLSEPESREIPILRKPRCAGDFPVEVMILVGQGTARVSVYDLEGLPTPQEIPEGETVTLTGFSDQIKHFTLTFEPVAGDVQNICYGARVELDCPGR